MRVTLKNGNALSAIVVCYGEYHLWYKFAFARACKPLRATSSAWRWCRHSTAFYYTFVFFCSNCQQQPKKSISFMRITLRSCCSPVLISIVVVDVVKMLNHHQTHCVAEWMAFFFWWPLQCTWLKWRNDNNRMRWQMEKFTLFACGMAQWEIWNGKLLLSM